MNNNSRLTNLDKNTRGLVARLTGGKIVINKYKNTRKCHKLSVVKKAEISKDELPTNFNDLDENNRREVLRKICLKYHFVCNYYGCEFFCQNRNIA